MTLCLLFFFVYVRCGCVVSEIKSFEAFTFQLPVAMRCCLTAFVSRALLKTLDKDCRCMHDRFETFSRMCLSAIYNVQTMERNGYSVAMYTVPAAGILNIRLTVPAVSKCQPTSKP